jgi:hypothetical protein
MEEEEPTQPVEEQPTEVEAPKEASMEVEEAPVEEPVEEVV